MKYRLTRRARQDVLDIWQYIASDNEAAADRFVERFARLFDRLSRNPYLGRTRDELRPGYRSFPVGQYVVFYEVARPGVVILHVIHGRRDLVNYPFES